MLDWKTFRADDLSTDKYQNLIIQNLIKNMDSELQQKSDPKEIKMEVVVNCASCKFYEKYEETREDGFTGWCRLCTSDDGMPSDSTTKAYAGDYEGFHAFLVVKPDFGCVMGETR